MSHHRIGGASGAARLITFWVTGVMFAGAAHAAGAPVTPAEAAAADAAVSGAASTAAAGGAAATPADSGGGDGSQLATVVVTAQRLNVARTTIETQTGASTYVITSEAIAATPGGENVQMNQVLLQAPDVVQDSFGQLHVRADHNDLQYRLNGIILPEGISVFSQTLSPRLISSLSLITGALPAEYGLRTAGVIDLSTNSGLLQPGGAVSAYGGSFGTFEPAFEYGGSSGKYSYYISGDYKQDNVGIESPDGSTDPLHDHTQQVHGFGYFEKIVDEDDRLALILGTSDDAFQIPNQRGLEPSLGLDVNGQSTFLSDDLNETQHEAAQYAILAWQHAAGALNWQTAVSARYTTLHFAPDWVGDLLYNGIAQNALKDDTAFGWQTDASYKLGDTHTVRAGLYLQHDSSQSYTTSQVLPVDPVSGVQTSNLPLTVADNGTQSQILDSVYLQDEWKPLSALTLNYGLRFDHYSAYSSGSQLSPRLNFVWELSSGTTVHGGYSRYFTPPPFELIGTETFAKFAGTTALPPGTVTEDAAPIAERANYYDFGIQQKLLDNTLTLGADSFYEQAQHLIDEGQFGAPIILTPFNYRYGLIGGVEFTANYSIKDFSTYGNLSFQAAHGKDVESSQFNFDADALAYIANNYIHLDHEGRVAASGGVSYLWMGTRFSSDFLFGTGLRDDLTLPSGAVIPNGDHTPSYLQANLGLSHDFQLTGSGPLTARLDVINVFDKAYEIRSGTGVGVFAPQWGPRRGLYGGLAWKF
ncbi:MAG TPA: TonB-dependent receptor [Steroidobacteraceae bacterium]|jgi:outer membrane receptor for ferrienterochelin and colicins|nr:TonB-dependent receptor [Steroidobacteraceae bacterium]